MEQQYATLIKARNANLYTPGIVDGRGQRTLSVRVSRPTVVNMLGVTATWARQRGIAFKAPAELADVWAGVKAQLERCGLEPVEVA